MVIYSFLIVKIKFMVRKMKIIPVEGKFMARNERIIARKMCTLIRERGIIGMIFSVMAFNEFLVFGSIPFDIQKHTMFLIPVDSNTGLKEKTGGIKMAFSINSLSQVSHKSPPEINSSFRNNFFVIFLIPPLDPLTFLLSLNEKISSHEEIFNTCTPLAPVYPIVRAV
jgi:hypothetical protein